MANAAIPPTMPPAMAPAFDLPRPDMGDPVAVEEEMGGVDTPKGPIIAPGPISGKSTKFLGVRPQRGKEMAGEKCSPPTAYDVLGSQSSSIWNALRLGC
jgi:hypothetical protein